MKEIEKITKIMNEKSLKYTDLATYLGVGKSVVSAWKTRKTNPPLEYIVQICRFLEVSIYEILDMEPQSEIEQLYKKCSADDKAIIDNILSRYKSQEQPSSSLMIG